MHDKSFRKEAQDVQMGQDGEAKLPGLQVEIPAGSRLWKCLLISLSNWFIDQNKSVPFWHSIKMIQVSSTWTDEVSEILALV